LPQFFQRYPSSPQAVPPSPPRAEPALARRTQAVPSTSQTKETARKILSPSSPTLPGFPASRLRSELASPLSRKGTQTPRESGIRRSQSPARQPRPDALPPSASCLRLWPRSRPAEGACAPRMTAPCGAHFWTILTQRILCLHWERGMPHARRHSCRYSSLPRPCAPAPEPRRNNYRPK
jgi:hypothetical protein